MIAFLGTGLLGGNFVRALRRRGEDVQVWNRSAEKARDLTDAGAIPFDDAADAVRGATRVHVAVSDDAAVDAVLEQASPGLRPGGSIVDHTTTAPEPTADRVRRWIARGFSFQHAPVFMGPHEALHATGTMLASGDRAVFDGVSAALAAMTGKLVYLGDDPARAAGFKLMGNLFLIAMTGGLVDMFALGKSLGISGVDAKEMLDWFNPGASAPTRAQRILSEDLTQPSWTLSMARKDVRLMIEAAGRHGTTLDVMPTIAAEMDRAIRAGRGADDWMSFGEAAVR